MSSPDVDEVVGDSGIEPLESAVRRLIAEVQGLRQAAAEARERAEHSDTLLRDFVEGRQDPAMLSRRLSEAENENDDLRARLDRVRERIDQILASIRFLEDRR